VQEIPQPWVVAGRVYQDSPDKEAIFEKIERKRKAL
jgi:hypothetical protein